MRVLVWGAGAVGQGVGGFLAAAGHDVALLLRPRYRRAIARGGLRVTGLFGDRFVAAGGVGLACDPAELKGGWDVVLLTVKSYDTAAAAAEMSDVLAPDTVVVSMQNGYGNVEALASRLGRQRVLCARVITGFSIPTPGRVEVTVHADSVHVGSFYARRDPTAEALADALDGAGLPAEAVETVQADLWGKILYNCALNPLGAVLGVHYGALGDCQPTRDVMNAIIDEAFDVIEACGFPYPWRTAGEYREVFYGRQLPATYDHRPSMLQDLRAGKRTEIDALNGAVVRLGSKEGVATPVNGTIAQLIRFLEARPAGRQ